jgi:hypothetical protein
MFKNPHCSGRPVPEGRRFLSTGGEFNKVLIFADHLIECEKANLKISSSLLTYCV